MQKARTHEGWVTLAKEEKILWWQEKEKSDGHLGCLRQ